MSKTESLALYQPGPTGITLADGEWRTVQRDKAEVEEMAALLRETFGADQTGLRNLIQRITVPKFDKGVKPKFSVPNGTDDPTAVTELSAIIVKVVASRAKWIKSFDEGGGGAPPDCSAPDGITGTVRLDETGRPVLAHTGSALTRPCAGCPFNKPRDCRLVEKLYLILPGDHVFPFVLHATPGMLAGLTEYKTKVVISHRAPLTAVMTKLTLTTLKSKVGAIDYNSIVFACEGKLDPALAARVKDYSREIESLITAHARLDETGDGSDGFTPAAPRPAMAPAPATSGSADDDDAPF